MKNLKLKIIYGFRRDQECTIEADEAHKAYYLFLNPEVRGIFNNGVAMIGADIKHIEPDYNATMGWNPTHVPTGDDWNEIREMHVDRKLREVAIQAKEIATSQPEKINRPLSEIMKLENPSVHKNTSGLTQIGNLIK